MGSHTAAYWLHTHHRCFSGWAERRWQESTKGKLQYSATPSKREIPHRTAEQHLKMIALKTASTLLNGSKEMETQLKLAMSDIHILHEGQIRMYIYIPSNSLTWGHGFLLRLRQGGESSGCASDTLCEWNKGVGRRAEGVRLWQYSAEHLAKGAGWSRVEGRWVAAASQSSATVGEHCSAGWCWGELLEWKSCMPPKAAVGSGQAII